MDKSFLRQSFIIFLFSLFLLGVGAGDNSLWDIDEPNNAQALKEMVSRNDYILPTFNGHIRPDKPILNYWIMAATTRLFGFNEWGLRAGAILFGGLLVWLIAVQTRRLFTPQAGLAAGLLAATALHSQIIFRAAVPDPVFIFMVSLSLLSWLLGYLQPEHRRRDYLIAYTALAFGVLAKGPIAVLLPGLIILVFLALRRDLAHLWRHGHLLAGIPLFLLIALPWYVAVGLQSHGQWLEQFLGMHNVGRFTASMEGHRGPPYFYLGTLLAALLPWSIFLPQALAMPVARHGKRLFQDAPAQGFMLLWAALWIVFFSIAATKLPNYIWPAYPPLFILIAHRLVQALSGEAPLKAWGGVMSFTALALAGAGLIVAGQVYLPKALPDMPTLGLLGGPYLLAGLVGIGFFLIRRLALAVMATTIAAVSFTFLIMAYGLPALEQLKPSRSFGRLIQNMQGQQPYALASYKWFQPSYLFYGAKGTQPVEQLGNVQQVDQLLKKYPAVYLALPKQDMSALFPILRPDIHAYVLMQEKDMYSGDTVTLIRFSKASTPG